MAGIGAIGATQNGIGNRVERNLASDGRFFQIHSDCRGHLVQKTGFRRPFKRQLADVSAQIRNTLFRTRKRNAMEKYVTDLRAKAQIKIDDAVLDSAKLKGPPRDLTPNLAPPKIDGLRLPSGKTPPMPRPKLPLPTEGR